MLPVGEWSEREQCHWLSSLLVFSHFPCYPQENGPFWCWFLGGWACVYSRTLWVSPRNSPVSPGVSPTTATPTGFFSQRFWGFTSLHWNPGLCGLSCTAVVRPSLSTQECGTTQSSRHRLALPGPLATDLLRVLSTPASHLRPSWGSGWVFLL